MRHAGWKILSVVAVVGLAAAAYAQPGPRGGGRGMGPGGGMGMGPGMGMRGPGAGMGQPGPLCPLQGDQGDINRPGPLCPLQGGQVGQGPAIRPQMGPAAQPGRRPAPAMGRGAWAGRRQALAGRGARGGFAPGRVAPLAARRPGLALGAGAPMARCIRWLDLSEDQQAKIKSILKEAAEERAKARTEIVGAVKEVLTEEQIKKLEDLQSRCPLGGPRLGIGRGQGPLGQAPAQGFGPGPARGRGLAPQDDRPAPGAWQGRGRGPGQGRGPGRGAGPRR